MTATTEVDGKATLKEEMGRVIRHYQRYTSEQRATLAASHRVVVSDRVGTWFYTHPDIPRRAFATRREAATAALVQANDMDAITAAILALAGQLTAVRVPMRYVPILDVRQAVDIPAWRFDRALVALAFAYQVWLRVDWTSTAAQDAAAIRHKAADFHLVSADSWRTLP